MSDEKRALFELLEVVHLPEWSPTPVVKMKPDRIQIAQARRLVDALYDDFGVRVNEHLVKKKWVPTPGVGANNPHDMGTFIERNEDGSWPLATPEDFFDPDDITVEQGADGQYVGIHHGSGIVERAKSATHAKLAVSAKLLQRIEEAAETDQAG
ncbi:hypothetical protein [Antrihabitans spumae]|uniref:Uncharacterized protein n=1 Tax=Antrihabitans spumae TaxID=3373370 RepID=A0ABW7KPP4_9NOCA